VRGKERERQPHGQPKTEKKEKKRKTNQTPKKKKKENHEDERTPKVTEDNSVLSKVYAAA